MKIFSWIVLGLCIAVILLLMLYLLFGHFLFKKTLARKNFKSRAKQKGVDKRLKEYNIDLCWWEKQKFEKVGVQSYDKLKLVGHFLNKKSPNTVIVVHGFGQTYQETQLHCKFFADKGFNVLAVDCRAHNTSEGNCVGFGWLDRIDLLSWIEFVNKKIENGKIILFGLSMGASAVCAVSGEKLPQNVVAIISDSAFANADRQFSHILKKYKFFGKLIKKHLFSYTKRVHSFNLKEVEITGQVKNTKVPILYIHGKEDDYVSIENLYLLFNATPESLRDKFVVEDAGHIMAYAVGGKIYEKKICDFLKSRTTITF